MQQLSAEEREELKRLSDEGYKYLAREENDSLYAYTQKPLEEEFFLDCLGRWTNNGYLRAVNDDLFLWVRWEDNEPYEIEKLLEV